MVIIIFFFSSEYYMQIIYWIFGQEKSFQVGTCFIHGFPDYLIIQRQEGKSNKHTPSSHSFNPQRQGSVLELKGLMRNLDSTCQR